MKYSELNEFDHETQEIIGQIMEKAGIVMLNTQEDIERFIVALVDSYSSKELLISDLAFLFGKLELVLEKIKIRDAHIGSMSLDNYIEMGSDVDWYLEYDPDEAKEMLKNIIGVAEELKTAHNKLKSKSVP